MRQLLELQGAAKLPEDMQWAIRMLLPRPAGSPAPVAPASAAAAVAMASGAGGTEGASHAAALALLAEHAQQAQAHVRCCCSHCPRSHSHMACSVVF